MPKLPNRELTSIERAALDAYKAFLAEHGTGPSIRQLGPLIGLKHNGAHQVMKRLRDKGYLLEKPVTQIRMRLSAKGRRAG